MIPDWLAPLFIAAAWLGGAALEHIRSKRALARNTAADRALLRMKRKELDEALLDTTAKARALEIATACIVDTLDHALEDVGLCQACARRLLVEVKRRREHVS